MANRAAKTKGAGKDAANSGKKSGTAKRSRAARQSGHVGKGSQKRTAKFHQSGGLDRELTARRKHQDLQKKKDHREHVKKHRGGANKDQTPAWQQADAEAEALAKPQSARSRAKGKGRATEQDHDDAQDGLGDDDDALSDSDSVADSLGDIDDDAEAAKHKLDLAALETADPEFYKYLKENDAELLDFDDDASLQLADDDDAIDVDATGDSGEIELTMETLRHWQTAMVKKRSLKALRSLLLALRSIAFAGEETIEGRRALPFVVRSPTVFNKVIVTALKFTPSLLQHFVPAKEQANGRFKLQTQSKQYSAAQRIVKSYFASINRLLEVGTDAQTIYLIVSESIKLTPYLVDDARASRQYLRSLLRLWSTSQQDNVRLAAFLVIRKVAAAGGPALLNTILKGTYLAILQAARDTNVHTLPALTLMKNSASELFLLNTDASYQLAFGYIRQLAVNLRSSMKSHTRDGFKLVYNWQFVHSIDFWSLVLSSACDASRDSERARAALEPLIYPLVQVAVGAARLVPTSRYYPLRFHLVRSLLRVQQRTGTFIPVSPLLLDMLDCAELKRKGKPSSQLKPLDFTYYIRAPPAYLRTRTYADGLIDELAFHLLDAFATVSLDIAFPELVVPSLVSLKRHAKKTTNPKLSQTLKLLCERLEANRDWIATRRSKVDFAPSNIDKLASFLAGEDVGKTPLGGHLRRERKLRDAKQALLERAARDEGDAEPENAVNDDE